MATTHREAHKIADATARIGTDRYHVDIQAGQHRLTADEPVGHGGADTGPPPFGLLLSGLGACTAITLRMYADRKGMPLEEVDVQLTYTVQDRTTRWIDRVVTLRGPLDDDHRRKLAEIAEKTPVTKAVRAGTEIRTTIERA
jgi:putative redox protein